MPSIDTNILLRLILKDVPIQVAKAEKLVKEHQNLTINDLAITETVFVLEKVIGLDRDDICELISSLLDNQNIQINQEIIFKTTTYYQMYPALSFNDCYLAAAANQSQKMPLYTFDKALAKNLPKIVTEL